MGTFRQTIEVANFERREFISLEALVDTGATYTAVPRDLLARLGVEPEEERPFVLANGQRVTYGMAWVRVRLNEKEQPTPVIFADAGSTTLLGAVTLEEFGLAVDPVNRKHVPVAGYLVGLRLDQPS